jgi:hypothetical protein
MVLIFLDPWFEIKRTSVKKPFLYQEMAFLFIAADLCQSAVLILAFATHTAYDNVPELALS